MMRRIIKEEAKRALREGSFPEEIEAVYGSPPPEMDDDDIPELDFNGIMERYAIDIADMLSRGASRPARVKDEVMGMIDDMCEHLKSYVNDWAVGETEDLESDEDMEEEDY
jgi:hypothetical protein